MLENGIEEQIKKDMGIFCFDKERYLERMHTQLNAVMDHVDAIRKRLKTETPKEIHHRTTDDLGRQIQMLMHETIMAYASWEAGEQYRGHLNRLKRAGALSEEERDEMVQGRS